MNCRIVCLLCVAVLVGSASQASAQYCQNGGETVSTFLSMVAVEGSLGVSLTSRTSRSTGDAIACGGELRTEAWVWGAGSAASANGWDNAGFTMFRAVSSPGTWYGKSKHWFLAFVWPDSTDWRSLGDRDADAYVPPPPPPPMCEPPPGGCSIEGSVWDETTCECTPGCPLIVDVKGNGYQLTRLEEGVVFDLDGDGVAGPLPWTAVGSDDSFLVLDRNGNGRVDNGRELFGNFTPAYADKLQPTVENGFSGLRFLEGPSYGPGRADGIMDSRDQVFSRLMLWTDRNHNGISEPDELIRLSSTDLASIETDYKESRRKDGLGNEFRQRARGWWRSENGVLTPRFIYDVWLGGR